MGMGSNKKRSSSVTVVWCVVLGLSLLVVEAAAGKDPSTCSLECRGRPWDYTRCMRECIRGAVLLAVHGGGRETGGVGGRQEEKLMKQEDLVLHLTDPAYDYCKDFCNGREGEDHQQCITDCYSDLSEAADLAAHGGAGGEEASGGAVDALTAADAQKHGIVKMNCICVRRGADGVCKSWYCQRLHLLDGVAKREEKEKMNQVGTAVYLPSWYCRERCNGQNDYISCFRRCAATPSPGRQEEAAELGNWRLLPRVLRI